METVRVSKTNTKKKGLRRYLETIFVPLRNFLVEMKIMSRTSFVSSKYFSGKFYKAMASKERGLSKRENLRMTLHIFISLYDHALVKNISLEDQR